MSTYVSVNTYTYSVTYVTDKLLNSIKKIILLSGLDPSKFTDDWEILENGISTWLNDKDLEQVHLEVFNSKTGNLVGRWDFEIFYNYSGDGSFSQDPDAIRYHIRKQGLDPKDCKYGIIVSLKSGHRNVQGWSDTSLRSTSGFVKQSIGTTINGSGLSAAAGFWRKK
jgi:hypothetical protein